MLLGRNTELQSLEDRYNSKENTITVLYGRKYIGKTHLLKEFVSNKSCLYYHARPASKIEQINQLKREVNELLESNIEDNTYEDIFIETAKIPSPVKLIIIEEFQNIAKYDDEFMEAVIALKNNRLYEGHIMIILTSSSIGWVENNMISHIGVNALEINAFTKLKSLEFIEVVRMFPKYTVEQTVEVYAITGGIPGYLAQWDKDRTVIDNIAENYLADSSMMKYEGHSFVKEELRETSVYSTILGAIAQGMYKLNELHNYTGFGRDKISVYIKNLIELEIVEKVFSYDSEGKEHTKKGIYRIKDNYVYFWYRYIYPNMSRLEMLTGKEFYDRYISSTIDAFVEETFVNVALEYLELMNRINKLPVKIKRKGSWWGKSGNIDIVIEGEDGKHIVAICNWKEEVMTSAMYEEFLDTVALSEISPDYIYVFSKGAFDAQIKRIEQDNDNVVLVSINEL
ncbi:ATP-binding protein [Falcatimonas sp. MSJ-15]|uniref:ATP-binding protein n=1 Tax=Falcatimonas sp. MSJ-15 TaxID=2841515 RepID=UPI001C111A2C|nr:ATP-binding protein [Falcatimonas sp. MSJ-15]MBU5470105.1 ATP-binding protein [Falcatimonas sp. MSJ-15]